MGPYETQEAGWAAVMTFDRTPIQEATVWFGPDPSIDEPLPETQPGPSLPKKVDCKGKRAAKALAVIMLDPKLKAVLRTTDPKAYQQALQALEPFGYPGPMPTLTEP